MKKPFNSYKTYSRPALQTFAAPKKSPSDVNILMSKL